MKKTFRKKEVVRIKCDYFLLINEIVRKSRFRDKTQDFVLPFDAFVDKVKGRDLNIIDSNYPSYKIDKRLM